MFKNIIIIIVTFFLYNKSFGNVNTDKIINYLDSFDTLKSNFIQINSNGDILTGKIAVFRPGRFRIEYNEISLLIISDGRKVAVINKKIKNISFYSLDDLPSSILLLKEMSLKNIDLTSVNDSENNIKVKFSVNDKDGLKIIHIVFEKKPFLMKKWMVESPDKTKIEFVFNNLLLNNQINKSHFDIDREDPRKVPWRN